MISSDIPGDVDQLRDAINQKVWSELPAEKARAREEQTRIAQKLHAEGSRHINGIGQKIGSIDSRTFFRHWQQNPGCMRDPTYIQELLRDSPKLCAPGFKPRVPRKPTYIIVYK